MNYKRVFLLCSERSGSNLLRILIGNHSQLCAPVPPQLFNSFLPFGNQLGDLTEPANARRLISIMIKYVNHPLTDWGLDESPEDIFSQFKPKNFVSIVDSLYLTKALQENKRGYVAKENYIFDYAGFVVYQLDPIDWIYLYRDPRDVVSSWLKNKVSYFTAYSTAADWNKEQKQCLSLKFSHGIDYQTVSYENLISDTETQISKILRYLNLPIEKHCFTNRQKREEAKRNKLWKNLNKPIDNSNKKKYKARLTEKQIKIIETVCKSQMETLGYFTDTACDWKPVLGSKYKWLDKVKGWVSKEMAKRKSIPELILDRNKLKKDLIQSLS